jgi:FkbM family methyltransferase
MRNQCNQVIHRSLSDGPDCRTNGEGWLIKEVARRGHVFVDVGANVGEWSALYQEAADGTARGVLIDASEAACHALMNRFGSTTGIEIINAAVSDEEGTMPFFEEADAGTHSSLVRSFASSDARTRTVRVTTVDHEAERLGLDRIDFLKVDAEGYDLHVLRGSRRLLSEGRIGLVQFEYNTPWAAVGSTLASALSLLDGLGYDTFLLKADGIHQFRYDTYGEFFACSTFVARSRHASGG